MWPRHAVQPLPLPRSQSKRQKKEERVRPLMAEESCTHWGYRHIYNSVMMMMGSFYCIGQLGLKQQNIDMETLELMNDAYIQALPRAEDLKRVEESTAASSLV
ncbi:unspecified product [Leishmania tarentolae]|uniref:Unspecified product n=1 Tax=Leishmania tarentolae TaxID=5689 RepID=A0A640KUV2_LEITA|nr:unspecified product [Leishmania tarentolae]